MKVTMRWKDNGHHYSRVPTHVMSLDELMVIKKEQ